MQVSQESLDVLGAFFWVLFFFVPIGQQFASNSNLDTRTIYRRFSRKITGSPPSWVFGVVWPILFLLLGLGTWLAWRSTDFAIESKNDYKVFFVFVGLHALFLKLWTPVFTGALNFSLGAVIIFLAIATNAVMLFFVVREKLWITVGFYAVELVWILYAFYLNLMSIRYQKCVTQAVNAMRCCRARLYGPCLDGAFKE